MFVALLVTVKRNWQNAQQTEVTKFAINSNKRKGRKEQIKNDIKQANSMGKRKQQ